MSQISSRNACMRQSSRHSTQTLEMHAFLLCVGVGHLSMWQYSCSVDTKPLL